MGFHFLGIGITYLGRRNVQYFFSNCRFCGKFSKIESHDVTSYLSLIFPLFPLDDRKIVKCHRCFKKRDQNLKEFNTDHQRALDPIFQTYLDDPHSDPKAERLLVGFMRHYDKDGFLEIVARMKRIFHREPAIMEAIGDTYLFFTCLQDAEKSYLSSITNNDNPVVREKLGLTLILQSRPHEAWPYLDHIITQRKEKGLWLLSLLVGSYQANGMHREALDILDHWKDSFPEYTLYQKYLRISRKQAGKNKKVKAKLLSTFSKATPKKGITSRTAHLFGLPFYPLLLILLVIIFRIAFSAATEQKVFLVNGLNHDCRIKLNGNSYRCEAANASPRDGSRNYILSKSLSKKTNFLKGIVYRIPKLGYQEITLTHGRYSVEESSGSFRFPPWKLTVKNRWDGWNRPVLVVNPDRLAVLSREQRRYYHLTRQEDLPLKLYYGKCLYLFKKNEEFFRDFQSPAGIPLLLSCTSKGIVATRLSLWDTAKPAETIALLEKYLSKDKRIAFFQRYLDYHQAESQSEIYRSYLERIK